jgi:hypothetical protein
MLHLKAIMKGSRGTAELAKASVIHPGDPGLNLGIERNIFLFCVCPIWLQICKVLNLEYYLLIYMYIDQ